MRHHVYCLLLAFYVCSYDALAAFSGHPACKTVSKTTWNKNQAMCRIALKNAESSGAISANEVKVACDCAADKLINESNCDDLHKLDNDPDFLKTRTEEIGAACAKLHPLKGAAS